MLVEYLHNVASVLQLRDIETGALIRDLPSGPGTIGGLSGNIDTSEVFWTYGSYKEPGTTFRCLQAGFACSHMGVFDCAFVRVLTCGVSVRE